MNYVQTVEQTRREIWRLAGHEAMAMQPYKRSAMTMQEKEAPIFPSLKEWHEQHSQKAAQVQAKSVGSTKPALVRTKAARVAPERPRPSYWTTSLPWGEGTRRK